MPPPRIIDLRKKLDQQAPAIGSMPSRPQRDAPEEEMIAWRAPAFTHYKKNRAEWIRNAVIVFGGIAALFLFLQNILGAAVMLLAGFTFLLYAFQEPRELRVKISPLGIHVDNKLYSFEHVKSFWIFYTPPERKELSIELKNALSPHIMLPLGETNPAEVRAVLTQFLSEAEQHESGLDILARLLRF